MTRANLEHAEQLLTGELIWHKLNPKQGWSESQVLFDNFKPTKKRSRSPNESQNERQSGQQTRVPANPSSTQSSHRSYSSQLVQPSRRTKRSGNVTTTIEQRPTVEIVYGDCFQELDDLEDESIDCVITDPPPPLARHGQKTLRQRSANLYWQIFQSSLKMCMLVGRQVPGSRPQRQGLCMSSNRNYRRCRCKRQQAHLHPRRCSRGWRVR
jgi:hypothetical protein